MTDLNAWNRPLANLEIEQFMDGCNESFSSKSKPNIINWPLINNSSIGNKVSLVELPESEICSQNLDSRQVQTRIMNYPLTFDKSRSLCTYLGGQMPLPSNESDFQAIFGNNLSSQMPDMCSGYFWLPIVQSNIAPTWVDARLETTSEIPVNYFHWAPGQPNGNFKLTMSRKQNIQLGPEWCQKLVWPNCYFRIFPS